MKKTACFVALLIGAAIVYVTGSSVESSRAADGAKFAIAYSGNIMGYFESCG